MPFDTSGRTAVSRFFDYFLHHDVSMMFPFVLRYRRTKRIGQHETGELGGYTHNRRPVTLMFSQPFATREEVLASERQIKGWNRAKKEALINGDWKRVQQLAWGTKNPLPEHLR